MRRLSPKTAIEIGYHITKDQIEKSVSKSFARIYKREKRGFRSFLEAKFRSFFRSCLRVNFDHNNGQNDLKFGI